MTRFEDNVKHVLIPMLADFVIPGAGVVKLFAQAPMSFGLAAVAIPKTGCKFSVIGDVTLAYLCNPGCPELN